MLGNGGVSYISLQVSIGGTITGFNGCVCVLVGSAAVLWNNGDVVSQHHC